MVALSQLRRAVLALAMVLVASAMAQNTWFVNAETGDDAATGKTPTAAFRTLARFKVLFDAGQVGPNETLVLAGTFRESMLLNFSSQPQSQGLTIRRWTSQDDPIGLSAGNPVVRGDTPVAGWARVGQTLRWTAAVQPGLEIESVVAGWDNSVDSLGRRYGHLRRVPSAGECEQTAGSWHYEGVTLSVNLGTEDATSPDQVGVGYVARGGNAGICLQWADGVTVNGIDAYLWLNSRTGTYGLSMENARNSRFINCRTRDTSHHGIGFTGATGNGNQIINCDAGGLMGLADDVDPTGDVFGMLSDGTSMSGAVISGSTAHCYSLLDVFGRALNPQRTIHGVRAGTNRHPTARVNGLEIVDCTIVHYGWDGGQFSTPVRLSDGAMPTNPEDPATFGVVLRRTTVINGGVIHMIGMGFNAAFVDCDIDLSRASMLGLWPSGAVVAGVPLGPTNSVLFKECRIRTNVDNPNGAFWNSVVFGLRGGTNLYLDATRVTESGLRRQNQQATMFFWLDAQGSVRARQSRFEYANARGIRRLCGNDASVFPFLRDFDGCNYTGLSNGTVYTQFFGPTFGLPDIRTAAGWLSNEIGDINGVAVGGLDFGRLPVRRAGDVAEDDEPK